MDVKYAAGYFDGEGCVTGHMSRGIPKVHVSMSSTYLPMLEEFQSQWGGSISAATRKFKKNHHKDAWIWTLGTRDLMIVFFNDITPHLVEKQPQAEVGLAMAKAMGKVGSRMSAEQRAVRVSGITELRELKHG